MKRSFLVLMLVFALLLGMTPIARAEAPAAWDGLWTYADADRELTRICASELEGKTWFFLPPEADPAELHLYFALSDGTDTVTAAGPLGSVPLTSGAALDLPALCGEAYPWELTLDAPNAEPLNVTFRTFRGAAMFLSSEDPENQGRQWVEASPDKSNRATGSMVLLDGQGTAVYAGALTQIKGRGNSTWAAPKRPYQIKLDTKTDLLQTGVKNNASKTWLLLANYYDPTSLRNAIAMDLGAAMGMEASVQHQPVTLFYDGEYRGLYQLTEKVEISKGRVNISDLENDNEKANPEINDFSTLERDSGITANGASYFYCRDMADPKDTTGGYLLEMEYDSRARLEPCYFITARNNYVVVKSPEFCTQTEMDYIASFYQDMEDAVYAGGTHPVTEAPLSRYLDLDSTVAAYLVNEFTKNLDSFFTSAFLYKDAGDGPLKMGPLWDYDFCMGDTRYPEVNDPEDYYALYLNFVRSLYAVEEFRTLTVQRFQNDLLPLLRVLTGAEESPEGSPVLSLEAYAHRIRSAALCNQVLWGDMPTPGTDWETAVSGLSAFIEARTAWMESAFAAWDPENPMELKHFLDVPPEAWYYSYINRAAELSIMRGTGYSLFCPDLLTTRAEMCQVLYNLAGNPAVPIVSPYPDVPVTKWYAAAITWASENGIVLGHTDGRFRPSNYITRQELVTMLYRAAGSPAAEQDLIGTYRDGDRVLPYARDAVNWALAEGILTGHANGTLDPQSSATRSQLATIMVRWYDLRNQD